MFSKPNSSTPQPTTPTTPGATPSPQPAVTPQAAPAPIASAPEPARPAPRPPKGSSIIGGDMVLEGDISGGGEIQVEGTIKGDVRVEHVTVGDGGAVEGGIYAEIVEVRGKVSGSITAKQVRLYGACHVDGDITHEQLAMETGAFFQGRSLRLQRQAAATATAAAPKPEPIPSRDSANGAAAKPSAPAAQA
jgi:cytoskeletal protein CcmA (bactofilin family)